MTDRSALSAALAGCTIVLAVDRRADELAAALERHGASVRRAPALTTVPHVDDEALLARTRELISAPPDIVVVTTGVGFQGWMEAAAEAGLVDDLKAALAGAQIVARGPKGRGAIQRAGLTSDWVSESEIAAEVGEFLLAEGVAGRRIAVQHHGSGADGLDGLFEKNGAEVVSLTVYRWGPPPDAEVVRRSVLAAGAGEVDAVLFTSAPGAHEWVSAARRAGALDDIRRRVRSGRLVAAAVGPITAEPLEAAGLDPLLSDRMRLGSLVRAVVTHFGGGHAANVATTAGRLELRSSGAVLEGRFLPLSRIDIDVLAALFDAGGGVVPGSHLQSTLPRSGEDEHAVEMAVARIGEALAAPDLISTELIGTDLIGTDRIGTDRIGTDLIGTVEKRGYRLNVLDPAEVSG